MKLSAYIITVDAGFAPNAGQTGSADFSIIAGVKVAHRVRSL